MNLSDTFFLFCENTGITILEKQPVQYGVKYKVSRHSEEAYITLFNNGNSLPQGSLDSRLMKLLQVWSCINPNQRQWTEEESRKIRGGMPDFYLSWREWMEDARNLADYIKDNGIPTEEQAPEGYKISREIMFHDYMFKKATDLNISLEAVSHIIRSWFSRFCFMNISAERLVDDLIDSIKRKWKEYITDDGLVSFYAVTEEIAYYFTHYCQAKWILSDKCALCPQVGESEDCIIDLVDSMYVYC